LRAADIDHLDRLVDADEPGPDRWRERGDVDDHEVDRRDALRLEVGHLLGHVAPGEDARIHGVMERLDLAADRAAAVSQVVDRSDFDPLTGQILARALGREHLHVECLEFPRERSDALPIRD
jgi:hypothetical protein